MDYAQSEFIVRSYHSCLDQPATIEEVRRILRLHLAQNATRYLLTERTLAQRAPDWVAAVQQWMQTEPPRR